MVLVPPVLVVTWTWTPCPAVPGGLVAVHVVFVHVTAVAAAVPKLIDVAAPAGARSVPVTVTVVPPASLPPLGLTEVTVGGAAVVVGGARTV
jgi:hypothetical protein